MANGYNRVILEGNLTRDIEIRKTSSGKKVGEFTLAVSTGYGQHERTDFITCTAWEKRAEVLEQYAPKGTKLLVEGAIRVESYEKDGVKRNSVKVLADNVILLGSKKTDVIEGGIQTYRGDSLATDDMPREHKANEPMPLDISMLGGEELISEDLDGGLDIPF